MLEELRSLSEINKKRVLIITTIIITVIIIGVWVSYFNGIIQGTVPRDSMQATSTVPIAVSGPSVWQNIKNGFGSVLDVFKKPSQYNIQPQ
jgi:hypothetical protein